MVYEPNGIAKKKMMKDGRVLDSEALSESVQVVK